MYNNNELQAVELSPTKKDYYQIWNELIDVAGKLSARWDPSATNESDPGIVLLKVLTAVADKLNYNIDANTLEAFMPSAAQESSMRKLCEMLGYNMQYFKSATTTVRITYKGLSFPSSGSITIDRFTNIKDKNSTYNYLTNEKVTLTPEAPSATVECIEGELVTCQTENGNVVTLNHLDDNNRFYLPEQQIASNDNCVFISRIDAPEDYWSSTSNLNTCLLGSKVYQFGYDSSRAVPYVQFPDDIGVLMGSGLIIKFLRTRGASGNIATQFLQMMEKPLSWDTVVKEESAEITAAEVVEQDSEEETTTEAWQDVEQYSIANLSPARNGRDPETIDEAYWNYQKTIGTFDTLVTCRDYMNKIYQLTKSDIDSTPLVSNVIVSDIRDDINRAYTVCTYTDQGLEYNRHAYKDKEDNDRIEYFDLILYPFEVYGLDTSDSFEQSFRYSSVDVGRITDELEQSKTLAHKFKVPEDKDIICIKVYFQLSARLAATHKVSTIEAAEIESAAHAALYSAFNMRQISFGDEIPYDSILKTLSYADPRIKNVILDDPKMLIKVCLKDGTEIPILGDYVYATIDDARDALEHYKRLVLANVLAGKVSLFNFNTDFEASYADKVYPVGSANLDTNMSLRQDSDVKENPSLINLYELANPPAKAKTQAFIEANPGTLVLQLCHDSASGKDKPDLDTAIAALGTITAEVYSKGAAQPEYTVKFSPDYADGNTDIKPSGLKVELVDRDNTPVKLETFTAFKSLLTTEFDKLNQDSNSWKEQSAITLCQIPLNLTSREDKNNIFDRVVVKATLTSAATDEYLNAFSALSLEWQWHQDNLSGNIELSKTSYVVDKNTEFIASAAENSMSSDFVLTVANPKESTSFIVQAYWPGAYTTDLSVAFEAEYSYENGQWTGATRYANETRMSEGKSLSEPPQFRCSVGEYSVIKVSDIIGAFLECTISHKLKSEPISYPTFFDPATATEIVQQDPETGELQVKPFGTNDEKPPMTGVSSKFEIYTDYIDADNPLVLKEGEVVQFRAPNFKSIATYPAYVNYYAHLTGGNKGSVKQSARSQPAIPATMQTLQQFFDGGPKASSATYGIYYQYISLIEETEGSGIWKPEQQPITVTTVDQASENAWNRRISWEEKMNSLPSSCIKKLFTTKADTADSPANANSNALYREYSEKYKAIFVKDGNGQYKLFDLPTDTDNNGNLVDEKGKPLGMPNNLTFYALHLTEECFLDFINWLQKKDLKIKYRDEDGTELYGEKLIQTIYSRARSNMSRTIGKLVDTAKFKYAELDSLSTAGPEALTTYYVPQLFQASTAKHTADGLGADATAVGLPANAEYRLKADEYILINYSTSEGREDGVSVAKNLVIGPNTIVKSNFELIDSAEKALLNKYPKTSNFGPWKLPNGTVINPDSIPGMFTFGATEQLEVREPISIDLDEAVTNLYWEVSSPVTQTENGITYEYFPFDKDTDSYILQAGEYLFYTNAAKENVAYYGAGTEIKRSSTTPEIRVNQAIKKISAVTANEIGLVASMPWTPFNLSGDKKLTISEYQIVNLAPGDSLCSVLFPEGATNTVISKDFKNVDGASYIVAAGAGELPQMVLDDISWQVRGKLEVYLSPSHPQTLAVHRTPTGQEVARDYLSLVFTEGEQVFTPLSTGADLDPVALAIYSNTPILGPDGQYKLTDKTIPKFKVCEVAEPTNLETITTADGSTTEKAETLSLAFDRNGFAKCDLGFGQAVLNQVVPEKAFNLITFYVPKAANESGGEITLTFEAASSSSTNGLAIFNYLSQSFREQNEKPYLTNIDENLLLSKFSWWDNLAKDDEENRRVVYKLRQGLNAVCLPESGTLIIRGTEQARVLYLSKVKTIPLKNQLNPKLAFKSQDLTLKINSLEYNNSKLFKYYTDLGTVSDDSIALSVTTAEVYDYIRDLDPDYNFYYAQVPSNIKGLDLNDLDPTDTLKEPKNWFDSQNIVNKFVVSELHAPYLQEYVHVSKYSRSQL